MKLTIHPGMRVKLLRDQQWEAGKVPAGAVGQVYRTCLPAGSWILAIRFDGIAAEHDRHFGIPEVVPSREYEIVG